MSNFDKDHDPFDEFMPDEEPTPGWDVQPGDTCDLCGSTFEYLPYDKCPVHGTMCEACGISHTISCLVYNELIREDATDS